MLGTTEEELNERLAKYADNFRVKFNPNPTVDKDRLVGLDFQNVKENKVGQIFEIKEGDTVVYTSGLFKPGSYVEDLDTAYLFDKSKEYKVTIYAYDIENGVRMNGVGVPLNLIYK